MPVVLDFFKSQLSAGCDVFAEKFIYGHNPLSELWPATGNPFTTVMLTKGLGNRKREL